MPIGSTNWLSRDGSLTGVIVMTKIIPWKVLKEKVPYSRQHLLRLEQMEPPAFPLRVRLGQHRIGWVEEEVDAWIEARMNDRGS